VPLFLALTKPGKALYDGMVPPDLFTNDMINELRYNCSLQIPVPLNTIFVVETITDKFEMDPKITVPLLKFFTVVQSAAADSIRHKIDKIIDPRQIAHRQWLMKIGVSLLVGALLMLAFVYRRGLSEVTARGVMWSLTQMRPPTAVQAPTPTYLAGNASQPPLSSSAAVSNAAQASTTPAVATTEASERATAAARAAASADATTTAAQPTTPPVIESGNVISRLFWGSAK